MKETFRRPHIATDHRTGDIHRTVLARYPAIIDPACHQIAGAERETVRRRLDRSPLARPCLDLDLEPCRR